MTNKSTVYEKTKEFYPHSFVRGEVLEAKVLTEKQIQRDIVGQTDTEPSKPIVDEYITGYNEVTLRDKTGKPRTFHFSGRLPEVGTQQAYSTRFECEIVKDPNRIIAVDLKQKLKSDEPKKSYN